MLLAFTTFEYFFREDKLFVGLAIISIAIMVSKGMYRNINIARPLTFIMILLFGVTIQAVFIDGISINRFVSLGITLVGSLSIATIIKNRFVTIFVTTMYYISIISIIVYIACLIPPIKSFLIDVVCPNFTSLNSELAVYEGGGQNFIIYNFSSNAILEATGLSRNSGPFWEPGMFSVFLIISIFLHNLVEKQSLKLCNTVFIVALLTTFSTGGFISGVMVLLLYLLTKQNNLFVSILGIIGLVFIAKYFMTLDFVGVKLLEQIDNAEVGTDLSRFGAFLTQVEMIKNSPILGGERMSDYLTGDSTTLASGTLLPLVTYGIPIGLYYIATMLFSFIRCVECHGQRAINGVMFFGIILFLSFSQTILLSSWMIVMIFIGLISSKNKYYERKI